MAGVPSLRPLNYLRREPSLSSMQGGNTERMLVYISGFHCRLGVFGFIHNVTSGLKVQRNKVTTGSIGVVRL